MVHFCVIEIHWKPSSLYITDTAEADVLLVCLETKLRPRRPLAVDHCPLWNVTLATRYLQVQQNPSRGLPMLALGDTRKPRYHPHGIRNARSLLVGKPL